MLYSNHIESLFGTWNDNVDGNILRDRRTRGFCINYQKIAYFPLFSILYSIKNFAQFSSLEQSDADVFPLGT